MNPEKILQPKTPFTTNPDHIHTFVKIGEFRKYDIKRCNAVGPHAIAKIVNADSDHKPVPCNKKIFVLRRRVHKGKEIGFIQPDIIVPVKLTNGVNVEYTPIR